ncbi:tetratricopeptide repeat protein [Rubrivirga marina]|uniref:Tetratrico peptide repeat group 5 domain-containing protein n=1 Tax=Rubrivirga marina TaxID=1196024 RepID=A0A271J2U2_9BACT|nr:tetratricopeptide repeat protein [Rubrivirga marina]PAP77617.1 hypothetical protein BSZ37_14790 [Rubrivirga marina]
MRRAPLLLLLLTTAATAQSGVDARLEGRFVRALTAVAIEDYETARETLDQILETTPGDASVLAVRAEVATGLGATADAVYYARRATEAAPDDAAAWLAFSAALLDAGQLREAADAAGRAVTIDPHDLDALTSAAEIAARLGDPAAERDALTTLVRVGDTAAARLRLSTLAERAGDRDEALAQARAAARLAPTEPAVARRLSDLQGTDRPAPPASGAEAGEADDVDALLALIDADPRRVDLWAQALDALAASADPRAGATADDALLLFPSVPAVLAAAAEAYAAAGRADDARATAQRGLAALDLLGDDLPDADALRLRLDAVLSR